MQESTFTLYITGTLSDKIPMPTPRGVELLGFVPDLTALYRDACFAICPILGRTGQQIKIVEAMAHGLPIVATAATAQGSPLIHAANGFATENAEVFASAVVRLWRDRAECRTLGQAAREKVANEYSEKELHRRLTALLDTTVAYTL